MLVRESVKFVVERGVVNTKGAGEVEYHAARIEKLRREIVADFMGGGEKHHIHAVGELANVAHRLQRQVKHAFQLRMQIGD